MHPYLGHIHGYQIRGQDNYRTWQHKTVVIEHLPSQEVFYFFHRLSQWIKDAPTIKALKTG